MFKWARLDQSNKSETLVCHPFTDHRLLFGMIKLRTFFNWSSLPSLPLIVHSLICYSYQKKNSQVHFTSLAQWSAKNSSYSEAHIVSTHKYGEVSYCIEKKCQKKLTARISELLCLYSNSKHINNSSSLNSSQLICNDFFWHKPFPGIFQPHARNILPKGFSKFSRELIMLFGIDTATGQRDIQA